MGNEVSIVAITNRLTELIAYAATELKNKIVPEALANRLKRLMKVTREIGSYNDERIIQTLNQIKPTISVVGRQLIETNEQELVRIGNNLRIIVNEIEEISKGRHVVFSIEESPEDAYLGNESHDIKFNDKKISLDELLRKIKNNQLIEEEILDQRLAKLSATVESLESDVKTRIDKIDELYNQTDIDLKNRLASVNDQMGTITAGTMAKDYGKFSSLEKKIADKYRNFSLLAMFGVAIFVSFSLWQVATQALTFSESIIRLSFILLISAPAAYLARESAKHRAQENQYRQTQLDLRAITPYIASLPPDEQSQLKTQIALRLFGAKGGSASVNEGTPLNANDLLLKLLDKVDLSAKASKTQD